MGHIEIINKGVIVSNKLHIKEFLRQQIKQLKSLRKARLINFNQTLRLIAMTC